MRKISNFKFQISNIFLIVSFFYFTAPAWATDIVSDNLEYISEEGKYIATGNVHINKEGAVMTADRAVFYNKTSDVEASGHVVYEDDDSYVNAEDAELNMKTKTGTLHNALIFFKKSNYWINGDNIKKIKEDHYYASSATFTTCDNAASSVADWCFKGKDVDMVIGGRMTAKDVTYRIKGLSVLYTPYMSVPIKVERETGFLFPAIGSSSRKGFQFSPAFFWAIDDNKDATVYLDYFSRRGLGTGLEYRYIDFNDRGRWYVYHLNDKDLGQDFIDIHGLHEQKFGNVRGYFDINYVNGRNFFKEYNFKRYSEAIYTEKEETTFYKEQELRTQRFLQSTGELSAPVGNSRVYFLDQYWRGLKDGDKNELQRLPELGYVVNPSRVGPFVFSMSSSVANFYREKETRGQRFDILPSISYAFGDALRLTQVLSLRETSYKLQNEEDFGKSPHRESLEYVANAMTRFTKGYGSFTHIIEPSLQYSFIPENHHLPLFDSTELFNRTSQAQVSLVNIFRFQTFSFATRFTQPYDLNPQGPASSLMPTVLEATLKGPVTMRFDIAHDFDKGETEKVNTEVTVMAAEKTTVTMGERYTKETGVKLYKAGIDSALSKKVSVNSSVWYDMKNGGLRDSLVSTTYSEQCWAIKMVLSRRPGYDSVPSEYGFTVFFELKGLGMFNLL